MPIPSAPPINAVQSPARAMRNSRGQTLTRDDISADDLSVLIAANDWWKPGGTPAAFAKLPHVKIREKLEEIKALERVMEGGNPEGKTLQDLTLILASLFLDAHKNESNRLCLAGDYGQMTLERECDGSVRTYAHVANNYREFKREKHAGINDELTLSVLRALYNESAVNNLLAVKNDYLPLLLVR